MGNVCHEINLSIVGVECCAVVCVSCCSSHLCCGMNEGTVNHICESTPKGVLNIADKDEYVCCETYLSVIVPIFML
jgi:hypothetical protein